MRLRRDEEISAEALRRLPSLPRWSGRVRLRHHDGYQEVRYRSPERSASRLLWRGRPVAGRGDHRPGRGLHRQSCGCRRSHGYRPVPRWDWAGCRSRPPRSPFLREACSLSIPMGLVDSREQDLDEGTARLCSALARPALYGPRPLDDLCHDVLATVPPEHPADDIGQGTQACHRAARCVECVGGVLRH